MFAWRLDKSPWPTLVPEFLLGTISTAFAQRTPPADPPDRASAAGTPPVPTARPTWHYCGAQVALLGESCICLRLQDLRRRLASFPRHLPSIPSAELPMGNHWAARRVPLWIAQLPDIAGLAKRRPKRGLADNLTCSGCPGSLSCRNQTDAGGGRVSGEGPAQSAGGSRARWQE